MTVKLHFIRALQENEMQAAFSQISFVQNVTIWENIFWFLFKVWKFPIISNRNAIFSCKNG